MADFRANQEGRGRREGIFAEEDFQYHADTDTYTCPAGEVLKRRKLKRDRGAYEYSASPDICTACHVRHLCTRSKPGVARPVKRHLGHESVQAGRLQSRSAEAGKDRIRRKWLMEGSFADAVNNHGFKRARWRRLWRQQIQDYLIATAQNVRILLRHKQSLGPVENTNDMMGENGPDSLQSSLHALVNTPWFVLSDSAGGNDLYWSLN